VLYAVLVLGYFASVTSAVYSLSMLAGNGIGSAHRGDNAAAFLRSSQILSASG
jgi:hypothetical protein